MSSANNLPMATSTPKPEPAKLSVLQEKQNNATSKEPRRRLSQKKINFDSRSQKLVKSKENVSKVPPRRSQSSEDKKETQKRQQALEAMQILEQRRHRMSQQNLVSEFDELSLKSPVESLDANEEKKRLEAKRMKEKKIRAFLAEQEARKKKEDVKETAPRLNQTDIIHHQKKQVSFKSKPFKMSQLPEEKENAPVLQIPRQCPSILGPQPPQKIFIRYSKDELRALNPYGYYFMWSATFHSLNIIHCMSIDTSTFFWFLFLL